MKALLTLLLFTAGCAAKRQEQIWLDTIEVSIGNGPIRVPLTKPEIIYDISNIQGACVSKDFKVATLLNVDSQCPPEWFTAKGKVIK